MLCGVLLPLAPVWSTVTTLTWPAPGQAVASASAIVVPYRPNTMTATLPCTALRTTAAGQPVTVLATGEGADGLVVTSGPTVATVDLDGRAVVVPVPVGTSDCRVDLSAGPAGVSVTSGDGPRIDLPDQPVPKVFGFRTDLSPSAAAGLAVTLEVTDPFGTSPGALKTTLIVAQLGCACAALLLFRRASRRWPRSRPRWRAAWWIDVAIVVALTGWAVIGPLAVDDGWATTIARTFAETGNPGNYYRWWNAAEVPFALDQQLLAPLTQISLAPLWLRLPSTVLAIATWFVLSRGVLGAALPRASRTWRLRLVAAATLLATWLPFNLGTRPESYVALGVTVVLALAMRTRSLFGLGCLALVAALVAPISPSAVIVLAPILVFAPRLLAVLRSASPTRQHLLGNVALLSCVAAIGLTVIFADQTWDSFSTATEWHAFFGPSLPWYEEGQRYQHLLQSDQQGSFAKRLPVLVSIAVLPIIALLVARRGDRDLIGRRAARLAAVVAMALLLFSISPSKWSYHLGAMAGLFAAMLVAGAVLVIHRARTPDRYRIGIGVGGSVLLAVVVAVGFDGPNAWWLPALYDVPWPAGPPRPLGVPLNEPLVWLAVVVIVLLATLLARRTRSTGPLVAAPVILGAAALGTMLTLLVGSFVAAPLRQPAGSLAVANLHRITGAAFCGLADDVELLPDGPVLAPSAQPGERLDGFLRDAGYPSDAPPPDPPGTGASAFLWGSRGPQRATMTSPWFVLPRQAPDGGVAVSVSGRTDAGNALSFEFGRADGTVVGAAVPPDRIASDEDPAHPLWRSIGVDAAVIPDDAQRVRIQATADVAARTDGFDWLAFTGPRLRTVVPLNRFLAGTGPVLVSWPQAFVFPCVLDVPMVSHGVAQSPRVVIESPRPWLRDDRKGTIGGTFHALEVFGDLREIPSRLVGAPTVDWGSVFVSGDSAVPDGYLSTTRRTPVSGSGGTPHPPPEP